jgi:quercetin dioxygenase-like cupin family protein
VSARPTHPTRAASADAPATTVLDPDVRAEPGAAVVVPTTAFDRDLAFFVDELGFALERIVPADDPRLADVAASGVRLRLERAPDDRPVHLRLPAGDDAATRRLTSPGGSTIDLEPVAAVLTLPDNRPSLTVSRAAHDDEWVTGRAGMRYRDLLPDRWGGRFIASHIAIPAGGPVPDYVHYHRVRFQLIAVRAGWVDVVYEGQGEPFRLHAGDCVLQPPQIRHRVLRSSPGLEVIEIGCPAEHETLVDDRLRLPTPERTPDRMFSGQRFVRHVADGAPTRPWRIGGWTARDSGIGAATAGLADVLFATPGDPPGEEWLSLDTELAMLVVMAGSVRFEPEAGDPVTLTGGDSVAIPGGLRHRLRAPSHDAELLDVTLPALAVVP